ncbi:YigZ family protein [Thiomicrospira sp.]|uniref:YigZ family protein n=1 Tax=Thiomicrospira sp. TaxID=935 RepID=UPI002F952E9E
MSYPIPAERHRAEIEIKKSRFIAYADFVETRAQAMAVLEKLKAAYPDARHHCWAYLLGDPLCASNAGMGDDGEPSGTAGKPILNVLQHKGVGDVMLVVVRYFGGIKLGAGGLTRAYSQAAQAVMESLPVQTFEAQVRLQLECGFGDEQVIRHQLELLNGTILQTEYSQQVRLEVQLPLATQTEFEAFLANRRIQILG